MIEALPRLRPEIDATPAQRDGEPWYVLYDRSGVAGGRLLVSAMGLLVAGKLDGFSSVLDIADGLCREYGSGTVDCSDVETVVAALSRARFLHDAVYSDFASQIERDFRVAPVRQAASAGSAYPSDPHLLDAYLDHILEQAPPPEEPVGSLSRRPRGIIAPHIDYGRGGHGYGQLYGMLKRFPPPRSVVIIGTAHSGLEERYSLCDKEFETPLGTLAVDGEMVQRLRAAAGKSLDNGILAHRGEHSIELQAVWLRKIYGDAVRIVPLLSGSLADFIEGERKPGEACDDETVQAVCRCLGDAALDGETLIMASADLSHVGPGFGDAEELTQKFLAEVESWDREYLSGVGRGPLTGLAALAAHNDRHRVCGVSSIFSLGMALPGSPTRLLGYHQAVSPEMRQAVSFAAMVFE